MFQPLTFPGPGPAPSQQCHHMFRCPGAGGRCVCNHFVIQPVISSYLPFYPGIVNFGSYISSILELIIWNLQDFYGKGISHNACSLLLVACLILATLIPVQSGPVEDEIVPGSA